MWAQLFSYFLPHFILVIFVVIKELELAAVSLQCDLNSIELPSHSCQEPYDVVDGVESAVVWTDGLQNSLNYTLLKNFVSSSFQPCHSHEHVLDGCRLSLCLQPLQRLTPRGLVTTQRFSLCVSLFVHGAIRYVVIVAAIGTHWCIAHWCIAHSTTVSENLWIASEDESSQ